MKNIDFTEEEIDLIKTGLSKLDQYDLDIKCEYDSSDLLTVQFSAKLSQEEKYTKMGEIADILDEVETQKELKLKPILDKLNS